MADDLLVDTTGDASAARVRLTIETAGDAPAAVPADFLAVPLVEPAAPLTGPAAALDAPLGGRLGALVASGEAAATPDSALVVHLDGQLAARRLAVVALGPLERLDADAVRTAAAAAARAAGSVGGTLAWPLDPALPLALAEQARAVVEGVALGSYDPGRWKTNGIHPRPLERLVLVGADEAAREGAARAETVARWTNRARDLANEPPNALTPERLAAVAAELAGALPQLAVEALGPEEIGRLGMGALAAVARASHNPARLIVVRYEPPAPVRPDELLGLVGKAITFDTGGISLKPARSMENMKGDMAGGAAVLCGLAAIAELGLPLRALAVVAASENMVGGGAYRPGDILTALNGKTIEVTNTDAEGRLVLADALAYARQLGATRLLDLATLTGAMALALGDLYAGAFGNDAAWRDTVVAAGAASGDHLWPFPLHPRYRRYVDSTFADMKNSSDLREASPALAAEFLQEFVGEGPWVHVDMAGPGFIDRSRGDYLSQRGGTGFGVRLVAELATRLAAPAARGGPRPR